MTPTPAAPPSPEYRYRVRIYYEDTDCMGVVYHANYLRYLERARSEAMALTGCTVVQWSERGLMFPVYSVNMTFKSPARLGDEIEVISVPRTVSSFRIGFDQRVENVRDRRVLVEAKVDLVCTDLKGNLQGLPPMTL